MNILIAAALLAAGAGTWGLTTEWRENPVGIDVCRPRLSWRLPEGCRTQTAYEIDANGWKSGRVESSEQLNVAWQGTALASSERVKWRVRVWDGDGVDRGWSDYATFVTGVMDPSDWKASWIASKDPQSSPKFVRTFTVCRKVVAATLHVTGVGFYVAELNGRRIGDKVLDPAPTDYDDRVLYSTYVLDGQIRKGTNTLAVTLGHGWYDVRATDAWDFRTAPWKGRPCAFAQLEIAYADGGREVVVTDGSWVEAESGVLFDDIREGEVQTGTIDEGRRAPCEVVTGPRGRLCAESQPGAKVVETIRPQRIHDLGDGRWFVDFGVNVAGWARISFRGLPKGRIVDICYDERSDGNVRPPENRHIDKLVKNFASSNVVAVASAFQTDHYIAAGLPVEVYEPRFVYHGFRFVTLTGLVEQPRVEDIEACAVNTDFRTTGSFRCSDESLNELMAMTDRSYRSNWTDGVPTDCPQREKNGWTGDASMASEVGQYFYENTAGYEKWLVDVLQAQRADGMIPGIVPTAGWGFDFTGWGGYPGPCWDGALPVIAWTLYAYRSDRQILERTYGAVSRNVTFWENERAKGPQGLIPEGLGDWCVAYDGEESDTSFVTTAWHRQNLLIAVRIAETLGHKDDAERFRSWAEKTRESINERFLADRILKDCPQGSRGLYVDNLYRGRQLISMGRQTMQAAALAFDIVPPELRTAAEKKLVDLMAYRYDHLEVGIQGLRVLLRQLSRIGRTDLALKALLQPTGPSFVEWSRKSSTLLEHWSGGSSWNHIMFGDFAAWAYQYLAGIRLTDELDACGLPVPAQPGFRHFVIKPDFVKLLDFVEAKTECPYGTIKSAWRRSGSEISMSVVIPPGTTADVTFPDGETRILSAGCHERSCREK